MPDVHETLKDRQGKYGEFAENAKITQDLKDVMRAADNWSHGKMPPIQMEALEVIAQKISRILTGDPWYADNWHDIAGYALLVEKDLKDGSTDKG